MKLPIALMVLMLSTSVLASEIILDMDKANVGDAEYSINIEKVGFLDRLRLNFGKGQAFTVIDGATCSINPDRSGDITVKSGNSFCVENKNHIGVAFQLFDVDRNWDYMGEKKIEKGEKKCFSVNTGVKYHYDLYFCDKVAKRECSDSDGGKDYYEKGTVTFESDGKKTKETDKCKSDTTLLEIYCDSDNSMASKSKSCDCANGKCLQDTDINLKEVEVKEGKNLILNQKFTIVGKARIEGRCDDCVIETGQSYYGQAFALTSTKGACDDDKTVGIKFDAEEEWIQFELKDVATKEGNYKIEVAAYNGCRKDVGSRQKKFDSETVTINVKAPEEPPEEPPEEKIECYYCVEEELFKGTYDKVCPSGTSETSIQCATEPEEPDCNNDPDSEACDPGDDPVEPYDPGDDELSFFDKYFDFTGNPVVAWSLTGLSIVIVVLLFGIITPRRRRK